jgi:hypothetical protein
MASITASPARRTGLRAPGYGVPVGLEMRLRGDRARRRWPTRRNDRSRRRKCYVRHVLPLQHVVVNEVLVWPWDSIKKLSRLDHRWSARLRTVRRVRQSAGRAIIEKKAVGKGRVPIWSGSTTPPHCGVGCQVTSRGPRANRIVKVTGREVRPTKGCFAKGAFRYEFLQPQTAHETIAPQNGKLERSLGRARRFTAGARLHRQTDGPDVFRPSVPVESPTKQYAIAKFTRAVIKTNNVDHCART